MAVEIKTRETWNRGAEVSFEVEAYEDGVKMFTPGATVTRDRQIRSNELQVSVSWSSSSNDNSIAVAMAQLGVMVRALEVAENLTVLIAAERSKAV